ncbi:MAG: cell division protein FtsA, partial [Halothiobacillaceae bacterium]
GTTDMAVFLDGAIRHTAVIPIAGDQVTNDIAVGLRTPTQFAEKIKLEHATLGHAPSGSEFIEVPSVGDRPARRLSRNSLGEIVEARYEEILMHVREELRRSGFEERVTAGVVLTGGCALMDGVVELAEEILHMPVRLGIPQRVSGMKDVARNPMHATGVGLLLFGQRGMRPSFLTRRPSASGPSTWERMKSWFQGHF